MILVSACLAGIPCRYDGKAKTITQLRKLVESGKAVAVCPEVLGGLSVPRVPCEIRNGRVLTKDGMDMTDAYRKGSEKALKICLKKHCDRAYLKEKSPACGVHRIHDGSFTERTMEGHGVFASLLMKNHIPCFNEEEYKENENESVR